MLTVSELRAKMPFIGMIMAKIEDQLISYAQHGCYRADLEIYPFRFDPSLVPEIKNELELHGYTIDNIDLIEVFPETGKNSERKLILTVNWLNDKPGKNKRPSRNLLVHVRDFLEAVQYELKSGKTPGENITASIIEMIKNELEIPERNCDKFLDERSAKIAFLKEFNDYMVGNDCYDLGDLKHNVNDIAQEYAEWLLKPVFNYKEGAK